MAATITQTEFKEALGRYPEILKTHGKTPIDGSVTIEDLDKFRYQIAPMNFSKNTGRVMELSDVEKLVQWKIHHGAFRPTLPKLVASNTSDTVAAATKDAFAAYANDHKDIATVISKLTTPLKGVGPATASLLLAIHDPQNVVFFSDELFSYLTADGRKVEPKYVTKEFETIHAEAQKIMSRLNCTPIELEKVAYVLVKEKVPEVKKAGRPAQEPKEKKAYTGAPRGRPKLTEAEKKAQQARREAARTKPSKSAINRTRTGRVIKPTDYLVNQASDKKTPRAKKPGRPAAKVATATKPAKKRGRPAAAKTEGVEKKVNAKTAATATKKVGRPAGKVVAIKKPGRPASTASKKPGSPATAVKNAGPAPAKKAGRPAKATTVAEASASTPKKRGRPPAAVTEATAATPASKKRGRPSQAEKNAAAQTPASKKKKTAATPATAPASLVKRGRPSAAASAAKRVGRKSIA
ncbi:uncharacterized protein RSE6_07493 [Rhynchosporium secalis]|uniref:Uncharacterized protein n=1 Tax=Rhynchosporium secalis TaxID=38038 RepID=A0A1E1MD44_RHYSE|nr:uncharacterized protein RSE6_07493 [Rhynchosporium secalis]